MTIRASAQTTLADLTDGYSVVLTNEAHTFLGTTNSVEGVQETNTMIQALRGSELVPCNVGPILGLPDGLAIVSDKKKPRPTLTITANSALKNSGSVSLPITIEETDIVINKIFSWSIAFKGTNGKPGNDGTSVTITEQSVTYKISDSGTVTPDDKDWSSSIPSLLPGQFLWTRTIVRYSDGKSTTSYSVSKNGNNGTSVTISSKEIKYAVSTSGTEAPLEGWQSEIPTVPQTQFLWTRTTVNYNNGESTIAYSVARQGEKGDAGLDAYSMTITSSNGTIFKNTAITTTLTAHVYKGGQEIPGNEIMKHGTINWYKDDSDIRYATGQTLVIGAGQVQDLANFTAKLE